MAANHFFLSLCRFYPPLLCYKMAPMKLVPVTKVLATIILLHLGPVYVWPRVAMAVMVVLEYKKPGIFVLPGATLLFLVDVLGSIKLLPITDVLI